MQEKGAKYLGRGGKKYLASLRSTWGKNLGPRGPVPEIGSAGLGERSGKLMGLPRGSGGQRKGLDGIFPVNLMGEKIGKNSQPGSEARRG